MASVVTRRRLCVAVALALVVGACGHTKNGGSTVGGTLTTPGETASTAPGDTNLSPSHPGTRPTTGSGHGGNGTATTKPSTHAGDPIRDAANHAPGALAGVVLAPGPATNVVLDVLVQPGVTADESVIATLRQILAASSGKPVSVRGPVALSTSTTTYDSDAIRRLADAQGKAQGDGTAVLHLLYLKGSFTDNSVLGVTVRADTTAVFPDQIAGATSPFVSRQRLEQAVDTHELGHVLGLVDLYLDDNRDDPQHPGHSTNPHSVMYWAVESDLVGQVLDGPPPVAFDGADQNDLSRIHAGASAAQ
ncbi:MAG: hypothetical protein QOK28_2790 [Actinomycetota bacterium]|jgi:hypothetical protein